MTIPDEIQRQLTRRAFLQKRTTGIGALAPTALFNPTPEDFGRDRHPRCFTMWMDLAGNVVKPLLA